MYWSRWRRTRFLSLLALFFEISIVRRAPRERKRERNTYDEQNAILFLSFSLLLRHKSTSICSDDMSDAYANAAKSVLILFIFFSAISSFIMEMEFDSVSKIFFFIILEETIKIWSKASSLHGNAEKLSGWWEQTASTLAQTLQMNAHARTHARTRDVRRKTTKFCNVI